MSNHGSWGSGDYNMTSDRNGNVYPRSEMRREWNGKWVHKSEWEERHPQDIIKAVKDNPRVTPVRDESAIINVVIDSSEPLAFVTSTNGMIISSDGLVAVTGQEAGATASSASITQYTEKHGVRFTLDKSELTSGVGFYLVFGNEDSIYTSTEYLYVAIEYNQGTDEIDVTTIGSDADNESNVASFAYTTGDQLCVSIDLSGCITFSYPTGSYAYTPTPAITSCRYFSIYAGFAIPNVSLSLTTAPTIYPTVIDYEVSTIPTNLPSYTPW